MPCHHHILGTPSTGRVDRTRCGPDAWIPKASWRWSLDWWPHHRNNNNIGRRVGQRKTITKADDGEGLTDPCQQQNKRIFGALDAKGAQSSTCRWDKVAGKLPWDSCGRKQCTSLVWRKEQQVDFSAVQKSGINVDTKRFDKSRGTDGREDARNGGIGPCADGNWQQVAV